MIESRFSNFFLWNFRGGGTWYRLSDGRSIRSAARLLVDCNWRRGGVLDAEAVHDYHIHSPVPGAALGGRIGIDWKSFRAPDDGEALSGQLESSAKSLQHRDGACTGEFPVTAESSVVYGDRVGVAFELDGIG